MKGKGNRGRMFHLFLVSLWVLISVMGCDDNIVPKSNENLSQLKAEWEREYTAWKALQIKNYEFTLTSESGINQKITVKDGIPATAIHTVLDEPVIPFYETIDAVFDLIYRGFLRDENLIFSPGQIGTYFSIYYDPEYHYPLIYDQIDIYEKKGHVVGNGVSIEIREFTLLEE